MPRSTQDFNFDWMFARGQEGFDQPEPGSDAWQEVRLPHDWSIHEPLANNADISSDRLPGGIGWYARQFSMPSAVQGRCTRIEFDGVYNNAEVWINGVTLGRHPYGYTAFSYDLTPHLRYGAAANTLAVRVDRTAYVDCRWYTGSGIHRDVKMVTTSALSIEQWGTTITTPVISDEMCEVTVVNTIGNLHAEAKQFKLVVTLYDDSGQQVSEGTSALTLDAGQRATFTQDLTINAPRRWDTVSPHLYRARCVLLDDVGPVDETDSTFGIREIAYDAATGFYLNSHPTLLKGVCLHQDGGGVGAAVPDGVWERRLRLLKEAGCNAIRTAHNPPSEAFLHLCDRLGFLVQDEAFDEFDHPKDKRKNYAERITEDVTRGYTESFDQWAERDIRSMVRRDRNHPSIVMWSLGNEVEWTYPNYGAATGYWDETNDASYYWTLPPCDAGTLKTNFAGLEHGEHVLAETAARLARWVREEDTTRPVTANLVLPSIGHFSGYTDVLDIVGYSYRTVLYDYGHEHYPEKPIFGAENWCKWSEWKPVLEKRFVPGIFLWTGINYIGETSEPGRRGSGSGLLDFAAFDTPSYHHFRTFWRDEPHIFASTIELAASEYRLGPEGDVVDEEEGAWKRRTWGWQPYRMHWNYDEGDPIVVEVFSNCPEVELFLDETSLGIRRLADFEDRIIKWHLPFAAGRLRAVGHRGTDRVSYEIQTGGAPARIALIPDKTVLAADGYDVVHLTAQLLDEIGNPVRYCEGEVTFEIDGDCRLLATDNGANRSRDGYDSPTCLTHQGRCLLILQSTRTFGEISVKATGAGIESETTRIQVHQMPRDPA